MFFQPFSAIYLHLKKQNLENYSLGVHDTTRLSCSSPFNSICDLIHSTEKNIRLGGPSLYIWHLALGSLLCTNFFVLSLVEQRKSILLPQMKKNTHKCNQSNWTISLNLKKKKQMGTRRERRGQRPDFGVCPHISFYPSLQTWFSVQGGAHDNGELRRRLGDTRLLPTPQSEVKIKEHRWPPLPNTDTCL